jgi:hypothetical protein
MVLDSVDPPIILRIDKDFVINGRRGAISVPEKEEHSTNILRRKNNVGNSI